MLYLVYRQNKEKENNSKFKVLAIMRREGKFSQFIIQYAAHLGGFKKIRFSAATIANALLSSKNSMSTSLRY